MKRSLQKRLTMMLGIAVIVSGFLAATISFIQAYREAKELQDDMLHQMAFLFSRNADPALAEHPPDRQQRTIRLDDNDSRISVVELPGDTSPLWYTEHIPAGLSTQKTAGDSLRMYVYRNPSGKTTIVTQPAEVRNDIAFDSAMRTFIPLVVFLPVMAWLIMRIVRGEVAPIRELAEHVDAHRSGLPSQLPIRNLPEEILPFIHAINRLLQRLGKLMGQQRRFVADAAHELRSPLAALTLQVQNLDHADSRESLKERIQSLQDGLKRARMLSEQLLNLARIQAGMENAALVDLSSMARLLIADYLPAAEAKEIDLGLEEETPLQLAGTEENFYLILKNALDNALQYTGTGGQVTIRLISAEDVAGFEIIDNGPGIPDAEQQRVFDPFYRVSGSSGNGSGLGLAIAAEAAACLGGTLSLFNRPDGPGLVFRYVQQRSEWKLAGDEKK